MQGHPAGGGHQVTGGAPTARQHLLAGLHFLVWSACNVRRRWGCFLLLPAKACLGDSGNAFQPRQLKLKRPHRWPPGTSPALPSGCGSREEPSATCQVRQSQRSSKARTSKSRFLAQLPRGASPQQQAADWLARGRARQSTASLMLGAWPRMIETEGGRARSSGMLWLPVAVGKLGLSGKGEAGGGPGRGGRGSTRSPSLPPPAAGVSIPKASRTPVSRLPPPPAG